ARRTGHERGHRGGRAMKPIRVMLADDHVLIRAGIRALLENLPGVEVVAEASEGREALALAEAHRPDVILTDIAMPALRGLELPAGIASQLPDTSILTLSMHSEEEYVCRALQVGAAGYLLKDSGTAELELAIQAVARGEPYLSPAVSKHIIADYLRRTSGESNQADQLTPRQREVLRLMAGGHTMKSIARALHISVKTVESHRAQLMERLDIHDLAGLVRYALRVGLIEPGE